MTFLSTQHSVSVNIHIPCSFTGSSTIFLLLFNTEFSAILLLKHETGHNTIILLNQKKHHLQKTKLEKVFIKTLYFSLKIMEMSQVGDSKWDWKNSFIKFKMIWISFLYTLGEFGDKTQELVKGLTKFGEAWINQTHSLRKSLKWTWVMNK